MRLGSVCAGAAALWLLLAAGCASGLALRPLRHQEDYYLREPGRVVFAFRRAFPDGGAIEGRLTFQIEEALWGSGPEKGYRLAGTVAVEREGYLPTLETARHAPMEVLREALPPEVQEEVFVPLDQGALPGFTGQAWEVRWERARDLRLPVTFKQAHPPQEFSSELHGRSREWAIEAVLVWHKLLWVKLGLQPFGRFGVLDVTEDDEAAKLRIEQRAPGQPPLLFDVVLRRGMGFFSLTADLGSEGRAEIWRADG